MCKKAAVVLSNVGKDSQCHVDLVTLFSFLPTDTVELETGPGHGHTGGGSWVIVQPAGSHLREKEK